jgi:hypothetical protein
MIERECSTVIPDSKLSDGNMIGSVVYLRLCSVEHPEILFGAGGGFQQF